MYRIDERKYLPCRLTLVMYYAQAVDNAISFCSLEDHNTGQPWMNIIYPVLDNIFSGFLIYVLSQLPAKSS